MHTNRGIKKDLEEIIQMTPEEICSDREIFDSLIYTDVDKAIKELHRRREDPDLKKRIEEFLGDIPIPEPLKDEAKVVMFRQVATPNYETSRFLMAADGLGIQPVFFEYLEDIFHPGNYAKKFLGKLAFHEGYGKKNGSIITYENIIDFNKSNGKMIIDVETFYGRKLHEIHHDFFKVNYSRIPESIFFDASEWFKKSGGSANKYYTSFLSLFIANGVLFENFMIKDEIEHRFILETVLPSFKKIFDFFKLKPIIVALEPTEIEGEIFWDCHNKKTKKHLDELKTK